MGWLFLATYFPNDYQGMLEMGGPIVEVEKEFLPFGHADIAGAIAARSLMPDRTVHAILHHHDPGIADCQVALAPDRDADFLTIVLSICDNLADCCEMDMFSPSRLSLEEIQASARVAWLGQFGRTPDLHALAYEELSKSKEIYEVYFADRGLD